MNIREQQIFGGCFIGFFVAIGAMAAGYTWAPAIMEPPVVFGSFIAITAAGGWLADRTFLAKARNYRR